MRNLTTTICLTVAVLLGSAGVCFALPPCPSDPTQYNDNCFGTKTFASGNKYAGEFKDGKQHGQGTATYADGNKYVGEYRNDKRHGQGTFTFADGNKYVGKWKNDLPNGLSVRTYADGRVEEGLFENGKFKYAQKS